MSGVSYKLGTVYQDLRQRLVSACGDSADLESRIILEKRTGFVWSDIIAKPDITIPESHYHLIQEDLVQRLSGKTLSRLYGQKEFWGMTFTVTSETLDPRPDTETLIEHALTLYKDAPPQTILDLGTGTGCILIALLNEFKNAHGIAIDKSFAALKTAQQNAAQNGCTDRIRFICGSWLAPLNAAFDLIVSNPPYIASQIIPTLDAEVKNHDPILALDGGNDGLMAYKEIFSDLKKIMKKESKALFEIGHDQGESILRLVEDSGLRADSLVRDLAGWPRVVEISRGDK